MSLPDYYAILEVSASATHAEIKRAYRRLARQYHPDLNATALDKHIKRLNEAYKVLANTTKRAAYDQQLLHEAQLRQAARETLQRQQAQASQEPKMTWIEGIFGFVRELRKEMKEN